MNKRNKIPSKTPPLPELHHYQSGLSLLLAIILIGFLVSASLGLASLVVNSVRRANDMKQSTNAYYIAEGALEQGLMINAIREHKNTGVGINFKSTCSDKTPCKSAFTIKGVLNSNSNNLKNALNIIPFPWTGDAPWQGKGSNGQSGCNPQNPPVPNSAYFLFGSSKTKYNVLNHPCNWNTIKVGEQVSIPLYSVTNNSTTQTYNNITSFKLRLRTPCENGANFCDTINRQKLNCFDKGTEEELCSLKDKISDRHKKGEVVMIWQIDTINTKTNQLISFLPYKKKKRSSSATHKYYPSDSEFYEGKINKNLTTATAANAFPDILNQSSLTVGPNNSTQIPISNILSNPNYTKPTLKLSLISNLVGCVNNLCPSQKGKTNPGIPYMEYQIDLGGNTLPPLESLPGPVNIITATGSSGAFTRTIQVKVPHESSNPEYVIQQ